MPKLGFILLTILMLCAGQLLAADSSAASAPASGDQAAGAQTDHFGKLPVTRVELAVAVARALAGGDAGVPAPAARPSYRDVPET